MSDAGADRDEGVLGYQVTHVVLRVALAGVALAILLSFALEAARRGCVLTSLSASWYTDSRAVLVAGLVTIGVALVAYSGGTWTENLLLDLAGALAPIVAFAPTRIDATDHVDVRCLGLGAAPAYDYAATDNALVVYLVGLFVGLGLTAAASDVVRRRLVSGGGLRPAQRWARLVGLGLGVLLVAGLVGWRLLDDHFASHVHLPAAATMFVLLTGVVALRTPRVSSWTARWDLYRDDDVRRGVARMRREQPYGRLYLGLVVVMTAALLFAVADRVVGLTAYAVVVTEVVLMACFLVFWAVQTWQLRGLLSDGSDLRDPGPAAPARRTMA